MKKVIQLIAAIKMVGMFAFTGGVMLTLFASMFLGRDSIYISHIWQIIVLSLIYGSLHFIAFSESMPWNITTTGRMALLGVSMLAALAAFAFIFGWFPAQNPINWLIFAGLYAVIYFTAILVFRLVFRLGGMKYNELLIAYKARHES